MLTNRHCCQNRSMSWFAMQLQHLAWYFEIRVGRLFSCECLCFSQSLLFSYLYTFVCVCVCVCVCIFLSVCMSVCSPISIFSFRPNTIHGVMSWREYDLPHAGVHLAGSSKYLLLHWRSTVETGGSSWAVLCSSALQEWLPGWSKCQCYRPVGILRCLGLMWS